MATDSDALLFVINSFSLRRHASTYFVPSGLDRMSRTKAAYLAVANWSRYRSKLMMAVTNSVLEMNEMKG